MKPSSPQKPDWLAERGAFPTAGAPSHLPDVTMRIGRAGRLEVEPAVDAGVAENVEAVLRESEIDRARVFYRVMGLVAALVVLALPLLEAPNWLRLQTGLSALLAGVVCAVMVRRSDRHAPYSEWVSAASGVVLPLLALPVIYTLGLFSAAATLLAVGIYFFGSSESRKVARSAYVATALGYFVATLSLALGLVRDLGAFTSEGVAQAVLIYRVVMQQVIFAMVFYLARSVRRANQAALFRAREKDAELRQREAQLLEAKGELDRALRQGEGRLSGHTLAGYAIEELLGRGGMGEVYAATHTDRKERVAIKFLHPTMLDDQDNARRFMREAEATKKVPSPHVAKVIEVGRTERDVPFIAMELLYGHDLGFYLRQSSQLPLNQVAEMVEHVAAALGAVREAGIVHRDLKPGNIFLTDTLPRTWKVLDFGLSKLQGADGITRDQAVGTPSYMAPEQVRGGEVSHLADLYALSAVAYRAITGRAPFVGDDLGKVLLDVVSTMPEDPTTFANLPMDLELVLLLGLAKNEGDRFEDVESFAHCFRSALSSHLPDDVRKRAWSLRRKSGWGARLSARAVAAPRPTPFLL